MKTDACLRQELRRRPSHPRPMLITSRCRIPTARELARAIEPCPRCGYYLACFWITLRRYF